MVRRPYMNAEPGTQGFTLKDPSHQILNRKLYAADSVIFRMGDDGSDAYIILRGNVDIITKVEGKLKPLATMGEGELYGGMALLNNSRSTANAVTKEGCEVLVISQKTIEEKLAKADPFIRSWISFLSNRIIGMNQTARPPAKPAAKASDKVATKPEPD